MRVGIDLGTTNTVVSYMDENGEWQLLEFKDYGRNEDRYLLPSVIAIENGIPLIGQRAVDYSINHLDDYCESRKREIGHRSDNWFVGGVDITPERMARYVLSAVYDELRSQFPQESVFNAFVTVPAGFSTLARRATRDILATAGFETDKNCLADEPVAAAVAYSSEIAMDSVVLVVDIGGGTFDLALLKTSAAGSADYTNRLSPIAVSSDLSNNLDLGGDAVDRKIFKEVVNQFNRNAGCDLPFNKNEMRTDEEKRAAAVLVSRMIDIKRGLYSSAREGHIYAEDFYKGKTLDVTITADVYRRIMTDDNNITEGYMTCIDNLFVGMGVGKHNVNHVLVVGGMSHEICLLELLERMFGAGRLLVPRDDVNMYLVSKGAAICNSNQKIHVENIAYVSIGLLVEKGQNVINIITEGEKIQEGQKLKLTRKLSDADATAVRITIVEYKGQFNPMRYVPILDEKIQIYKNKITDFEFIKKVFMPKLDFEFEFGEDKILYVSVKQQTGRKDNLELRLGGK